MAVTFAQAPASDPAASRECLECHAAKFPASAYARSVHNTLTCLACHIRDGTAAALPSTPLKPKCVIPFKAVNCSNCHEAIVKEHAQSVHNSQRLPIQCGQCHTDIHTITSIKHDKVASARLCSQCHSRQAGYFESSHFKALSEGKQDGATCTDCHGEHAIARIDNQSQGRLFHTQACLKCHADAGMMARNQITQIAPETFFASYHGKNVRLGYPQRVAGCADCHGAHKILKAADPESTVHADRLVATCSQCHAQASSRFVQFAPHAKPSDRGKFPALFWTMAGMTALLVGTFAFFWVHSLLWAFRAFIEKRQKRIAESFPRISAVSSVGTAVSDPAADPNSKKVYRRFKPVHIFLHLSVVISFLGLAITGLPLKFSGTPWAKFMMDAIGGPARAGTIHRVCAGITVAYFIAGLGLSGYFLFFDKKQKGTALQRLLGPDSLCPNLRDLRDLRGMFRWFFFRGPKPAFERWTYWEKFDFMAVFWGVVVIGSSGLLLWFPVFFGRFMPGWMFNIATIIHSDEALLATGFIFTIHFFNTHFRPEKFPMDFVIFNGEVTQKELREERADQWERYQQQGAAALDEVKKPSSAAWDLTFRIFGFLAVLTGLILATAMFYTFLAHLG